MKKVAIYARVSTNLQNCEMQLSDLRKYAQAREMELYKEYVDIGISGSIASRPQLNQLMDDARKKKFDIVLVWRFDRFARNSAHLINSLREFKTLGIDFISFQENIDSSTPLGEAIFTIIGAMAQLERDIITERIIAGIKRAKEKGKMLGRPQKPLEKEKILELSQNGESIRKIAYILNIPKSTVGAFLKSVQKI